MYSILEIRKYNKTRKYHPEEYEKILHWFYEQEDKTSLQLKATCAPQYYRIRQERRGEGSKNITDDASGLHSVTRGCLGGVGFCFISHRGQVSPCGYLELDFGNVRKDTLQRIWTHSPDFEALRDFKRYEGRCGVCKFVRICGGCRARAYAATGNYLAEDPYCSYQPRGN